MVRWLRTHHPLIWRTRIYWMLPVLVSANLVAFLLGGSQTFFPYDALIINDLAERVLVVNASLMLLFLFWAYRQFQWPLRDLSLNASVVTILLYFFMFFSAQFPSLIYANQVVKKISLAIGDQEFFEDMKMAYANNFWLCSYSQAYDDPSLEPLLDKYGFTGVFPSYYSSSMPESEQDWLVKHCGSADYDGEYTGFLGLSGKEVDFGLKERLNSILAAKQMQEGRGVYNQRYSVDYKDELIYALLKSVILLIAFSAINIERIVKRFRVNWDSLVQVVAYPLKVVKPLDHWLVRYYPKTWALGNLPRFVALFMAGSFTALCMPLAQKIPDFDERGEAFFFIFALPIWALANLALVQRHQFLSFRGDSFLEHLWAMLRIVACQMVFGLFCYFLLNSLKEMSDNSSREFLIIILFMSVSFTVPVYISHYLRWPGVIASALGFGVAVVLLIVLEQMRLRGEVLPLILWAAILLAFHIYNVNHRSTLSIILLAFAVGGAVLPMAIFLVEFFDDLNWPKSKYDEEFGFIVALSTQLVLASFFASAMGCYVSEPLKFK